MPERLPLNTSDLTICPHLAADRLGGLGGGAGGAGQLHYLQVVTLRLQGSLYLLCACAEALRSLSPVSGFFYKRIQPRLRIHVNMISGVAMMIAMVNQKGMSLTHTDEVSGAKKFIPKKPR